MILLYTGWMSNYLFCNLFFLLLLSTSYKHHHRHTLLLRRPQKNTVTITSRLVCPLFNEIKKDTQEDPKKTTKTQLSTFFEYDECVYLCGNKKTNKKLAWFLWVCKGCKAREKIKRKENTIQRDSERERKSFKKLVDKTKEEITFYKIFVVRINKRCVWYVEYLSRWLGEMTTVRGSAAL